MSTTSFIVQLDVNKFQMSCLTLEINGSTEVIWKNKVKGPRKKKKKKEDRGYNFALIQYWN